MPKLKGKGNLENVKVDLNSPLLMRYLRSQSPMAMDGFNYRSPLSSVENLMLMDKCYPPSPLYRTPVRALQREEVLVMDGVPVTTRTSRSASASDSSSSSASSDSPGKNTNPCYAAKFQFAHGKLQPTRCLVKNKSETQMSKSYTSTGSCTRSPKSRFVPQVMASAVTEAATTQAGLSTYSKNTIKTPTTTKSTIISSDWSPQDDGIEVVLPHSSIGKPPSREDIDLYINGVLHGPTTRRRLPVFAEISLK